MSSDRTTYLCAVTQEDLVSVRIGDRVEPMLAVCLIIKSRAHETEEIKHGYDEADDVLYLDRVHRNIASDERIRSLHFAEEVEHANSSTL